MAWPNTCEYCGTAFESQREWAKYCSARHRNAAARDRKKDAQREVDHAKDEGFEAGKLEEYTLAELERVGRVESALGQAVLIMARVIDRGTDQPIASMATAIAGHRTALLAATAGSSSVNPTKTQPTQLQEWRQQRERSDVRNRNRRGRPAN